MDSKNVSFQFYKKKISLNQINVHSVNVYLQNYQIEFFFVVKIL